MAFYRSLLEEEIKVLDDNNTNDPAVEELISDIDKQMDNEEEVAASQDATFGDEPGPDAQDAMDESFLVIAESEMNWNAIMQEVAINELNESVLTESLEGIKSWFKKAKDSVVNFFKKVFQVIKRWASNLFAMMHTNKSFATKYSSQISTGEKIYNDKNKDVKKLKGFPFSDYIKNDKVWVTIKGDATAIKDTAKNIIDMGKRGTEMNGGSMLGNSQLKEFLDYKFDDGVTTIDLSKTRSKVDSLLRFGKEGHEDDGPEEMEVGMSASEITAILKDGSKIKKNTSEALDSAKKALKASIDALDSYEKWLTNNNKENSKDNYIKYAVKLRQTISNINSGVQVIRASAMSNLKKYIHQARRFGNYYVQLANKGNYKMKGFQKESTFTSGLDLI